MALFSLMAVVAARGMQWPGLLTVPAHFSMDRKESPVALFPCQIGFGPRLPISNFNSTTEQNKTKQNKTKQNLPQKKKMKKKKKKKKMK